MNLPVERVIRPRRSVLAVDWRRILQFRDLLLALIRRDFVARYQQTILGPTWFVIQPLIATGAFTLIFSGGLGTSTDGVQPAFLFYLCGMLPWSFFANVVGTAGNTFQANAAVFTKVYFPRAIVPLAVTLGCFAPFILQLAMFLILYAVNLSSATGWSPQWGLVALLPLAIAQVAVFSLGVALATSGASAKYRDLQHALPFLLQLGLFITPVIYPLSELGSRAQRFAAVNPLSAPVELFRAAFFGRGAVTVPLMLTSAAGTIFILAIGLFLFQRAERTFADTV